MLQSVGSQSQTQLSDWTTTIPLPGTLDPWRRLCELNRHWHHPHGRSQDTDQETANYIPQAKSAPAQVYGKVFLAHSHTHSLLSWLWPVFQRLYDPQSWKYLPPSLSQKKFANSCIKQIKLHVRLLLSPHPINHSVSSADIHAKLSSEHSMRTTLLNSHNSLWNILLKSESMGRRWGRGDWVVGKALMGMKVPGGGAKSRQELVDSM